MNDESVIRFLKVAAFIVGFFLLDYLLYRLLYPPVHVDPPEFPLHEQPQGEGDGGNRNRAGQQEDHPEQQAAQDGDGEREAEAEDDPQQEADLGDGEGGGGDQQEDDGGHHQHLPLLLPDSDLHHRNVLPGNDGNHEGPRTDKVKPIQDGNPSEAFGRKETKWEAEPIF